MKPAEKRKKRDNKYTMALEVSGEAGGVDAKMQMHEASRHWSFPLALHILRWKRAYMYLLIIK